MKERLRKHKRMLTRGIHDNIYLQRAWIKYDGNFSSEVIHIIDTGDKEKDRLLAIAKEQEIIDSYEVVKNIYNISPSALTGILRGSDHPAYGKPFREYVGEEGYKKHQKHAKKMSVENIGENNPFYGKKHTAETLELLRVKCANFGVDNGFYGKHHTEDTLETLRAKAKGKRVSIEGVEYCSIREAARLTDYTRAVIKYRVDSNLEKYNDFYFL